MTLVERWRPTLRPVRAWMMGQGFWRPALTVAALVPLVAVVHVSPWVCLPTAAALLACAAAAGVGDSRRAGDLLLIGSLVVGLLRAFWDVGRPIQLIYTVLVLTVTGLAIRAVPSPGREAAGSG